jgi:hypothetical protein
MVTIFDMLTGEVLHSEAAIEATGVKAPAAHDHRLIAPRLQTVEEAKACEARHCGMPTDLAQLDIGSFIARQ